MNFLTHRQFVLFFLLLWVVVLLLKQHHFVIVLNHRFLLYLLLLLPLEDVPTRGCSFTLLGRTCNSLAIFTASIPIYHHMITLVSLLKLRFRLKFMVKIGRIFFQKVWFLYFSIRIFLQHLNLLLLLGFLKGCLSSCSSSNHKR